MLAYLGRGALHHQDGIERLKKVSFCAKIVIAIGIIVLISSVALAFLAAAGHMEYTIPSTNILAPALHPFIPAGIFLASFIIIFGVSAGISCYHKWLGEKHGITSKEWLAISEIEANTKKNDSETSNIPNDTSSSESDY